MAKALAESGIFVASIDFRMPPVAPHPGAAQDINLGIRWLKASAREFQGRPEWIGSWGTSSGAAVAVGILPGLAILQSGRWFDSCFVAAPGDSPCART